MNWIENAIDDLLAKSQNDLISRIEQVGFEIAVSGTKALGYCHCIKLDGDGKPRWKDLGEYVAYRIVDYAIPKKEIDAASEYLKTTGSTAKIIELKTKAAALFTDLEKTGEGGEMLLYILTQEFLQIPQLISKMSLKTSGQVHYQGVDGIHVKYDKATDHLLLYWGESKMYADIDSALEECFKSLNGYLLDAYGHGSKNERDLQLITNSVAANVNNEDLENLLVRYFDKDDDLSNKLKYKGICFIGFNFDEYPKKPMEMDLAQVKAAVNDKLSKWITTTGKNIQKYPDLDQYEIHIFFIPFPSVQDFRDHFIETIKT